MSRKATISHWAAGIVLFAALLSASCGSGAVEGPEGDDSVAAERQANDDGSGGGPSGGGGDPSGGGGDRYSWSLPVGDLSPDGSVDIYNALRAGCDEGEAAVDARAAQDDGFLDELLYRAAIAICRGDVEQGRALFRGAGTHGAGVGCLIREAILSVLEQRPQDVSACPYDTISEGDETTTSSPEGEETTTSSPEGEETTTTSIAGGGAAPTEPDDEGDDGA